jgi:hypothetical protein
MDVQSPIVCLPLSFPSLSIHHTPPQNNIQPSPPSSSSSAAFSVPSSNPPPPFPVHPPTSDEIDAVIQQATSSVSSDGRHVPLKDTRTQLFVGNVRSSLFPFPLSFYFIFFPFWPLSPRLPVLYSSRPALAPSMIGTGKGTGARAGIAPVPAFTFHPLHQIAPSLHETDS